MATMDPISHDTLILYLVNPKLIFKLPYYLIVTITMSYPERFSTFSWAIKNVTSTAFWSEGEGQKDLELIENLRYFGLTF